MFKAGAKCFRSCDNDVLVMLIAVYGIGWDARSGTGPSLGPAPASTRGNYCVDVSCVGSGAWCLVWPLASVEGVSVETWSGAAAVVSW